MDKQDIQHDDQTAKVTALQNGLRLFIDAIENVDAGLDSGLYERLMQPVHDFIKQLYHEQHLVNYHALYLRAVADLQNHIKQSEARAQEMVKFGNKQLIKQLIGMIVSFDQGLMHNPNDIGLQMLKQQLLEMLTKQNVTIIAPECGMTVDPVKHACIEVRDVGQSPGTVIEVKQVGYMLHDQVLSPAQVVLQQE